MKEVGRKSLERAVSSARESITLETDTDIVIDRTGFASRKRGRVALSTISNLPEASMGSCKVDESAFWRYIFTLRFIHGLE